jgi:hypothetical protein
MRETGEGMKASNKLKLLILAKWHSKYGPNTTEAEIEADYDSIDSDDEGDKGYCFQDAESEIRGSGEETGIDPKVYSNHYEVAVHAKKSLDGSWVGFNYWFGGGKHGDPGAMDWIDTAFDLTAKDVVKTVRVFERVAP